MHYVKKAPTTEEERKAKEVRRAAEVKAYCTARTRIFEKRDKGEFDDELLAVSRKVLEKNPDINTFWNIRRQAIDVIFSKLKDDDEDKKAMRHLLEDELALTQQSLVEGNPKSYPAWFQRGWVMKKFVEKGFSPDFARELAVCSKALDMDDRNFHCWDHRRLVSSLANVSDEDELKWSLGRVDKNFSNYSAWHYRSVLLPKVEEKKNGTPVLDQAVLKQELEKATDAFFMDSEDQSCYVYSRWLMSIGSCKEFLLASSPSPSVPLSVTFNGTQTTVVMSKACDVETLLEFVKIEDPSLLKPLSAVSVNPRSANIWVYTSASHLSAKLDGNHEKWHSVKEKKPLVQRELMKVAFDLDDGARLPMPVVGQLKEKLEELMNAPPISAWTLYTYTLCLMEASPAGSHMKIVENLTKLASELDPFRKEVYLSLLSRQELNQILRQRSEEGKSLLERLIDGEEDSLHLRYHNITSLKGIELLAGFVKDLCVQGNKIDSLEDIQLLPNLERLTISENPISSLPALPSLSRLGSITAASCKFSRVEDVLPAIRSLPALEKFIFPETELSDLCGELHQSLEGRDIRLIPHWP